MPASGAPGLADTPTPELLARLVLAGGLAVWLAMRAGPLLLEAMTAYLEAGVQWLDTRYRVEFALSYRTGHGRLGSELALLGRAEVARLFFIPVEGRVIAMQPGQFLTSSTAVGVLMQPAVAIVTVVLGWPSRGRLELPARALFGAGMAGLWFAAGLPATLWLYFRDLPLRAFAPGEVGFATPVGKFLLNGGSVAAGVALGALAVAAGARLATALARRRCAPRATAAAGA